MKQPARGGVPDGMNPEILKLITDRERYRNLRRSVTDRKVQQELDQLIKETEERLSELENTTKHRWPSSSVAPDETTPARRC